MDVHYEQHGYRSPDYTDETSMALATGLGGRWTGSLSATPWHSWPSWVSNGCPSIQNASRTSQMPLDAKDSIIG